MTPYAPGSRSAVLTGPSFDISKALNTTKAKSTCVMLLGLAPTRATHMPAHSSMTIQPGSCSESCRRLAATAMVPTTTTTTSSSTCVNTELDSRLIWSAHHVNAAPRVPKVPGAAPVAPLPKPMLITFATLDVMVGAFFSSAVVMQELL